MILFNIFAPFLRCLDSETAHRLTIKALQCGLAPKFETKDRPRLEQSLFGRTFPNPVGLAAGFDKNAEVPDEMLGLGFGYVEVGSVTPMPQPGNPRPRLFRLTEDGAVINRMGFNNEGGAAVHARLTARRGNGIVGVNLGKNKTSENAVADYVDGVERFGDVADYLVVNVSSPNTPGLRALQGRQELTELLLAVVAARNAVPEAVRRPPILLKIAPDLTDEDKTDIAAVAGDTGVDGLICTNTTISRPQGLVSRRRTETGGLSGRPLASLSTSVLSDMYRLTGGRIPLIGVGGVHDAATAYAKIRAGASLLQLYSALVYQGPALVGRLLDGLEASLDRDGFTHLSEAVGADHREDG